MRRLYIEWGRLLRAPQPIAILGVITGAFGLVLGWDLLREIITGVNPIAPVGDHNDFLAFYTAAKLALSGNVQHLYSATQFAQAQHAISHRNIGWEGYMPYLNPPFVAVLLAPLGLLGEPASRIIWLIINSLLAVWLLTKLVKPLALKQKWLAVALLMGTFPIYENLIEGQLTLLILAGCYCALGQAKQHHNRTAGLWLAVLWIKPQFAGMLLVGLLLFRAWETAQGLALGGLALLVITLPLSGLTSYLNYGHFLLGVAAAHTNGAGAVHQSVWQGTLKLTAGVNGVYTAIFGQSRVFIVNAATAATDLLLMSAYFVTAWKVRPNLQTSPGRFMLVAGIGLIMLLDPHLFQQDVVLLFLLLPILAAELKRSLAAVILLALVANFLAFDYIEPIHIFSLLLIAGVGALLVRQHLPQQRPSAKPTPRLSGQRR